MVGIVISPSAAAGCTRCNRLLCCFSHGHAIRLMESNGIGDQRTPPFALAGIQAFFSGNRLASSDFFLTIYDRYDWRASMMQPTRQGKPAAKQTTETVSADGLVRVGPLTAIPAILRELGCAPEALFAAGGFNLAQFENPDTEISYVAASKLLANCVVATGCRHFGLLLGMRSGPSSLGLPGFMLRTAPTVRLALEGLVSHLDLHDQGGTATLATNGEVTLLSYVVHQVGAEATDQIYDLSIAVICNIMRSLCGPAWKPTAVLLSRQAPLDLGLYRAFFRAPLRFDAELSAVAFASNWLDRPVSSADPLLHRHLERQAEDLHRLREESMAGRLRRLLRLALSGGEFRVTDIAGQLGMHERTLNRRLRTEGTTFRDELNEIRYEVARQLLAESNLSLGKIAAALDYGDATAFSRAFKRWSGSTPAKWRERNAPPA